MYHHVHMRTCFASFVDFFAEICYFFAIQKTISQRTWRLLRQPNIQPEFSHRICYISTYARPNVSLISYIFFSIRFFFTDTDDSQDSRGREGKIFFSNLPLPPAHEHWEIYLQLCMWDDYQVFLIATLVFTRLLLNEIYQLIKLPFAWLTDGTMLVSYISISGLYWEKIPGNLKQIDSGPYNVVWGVNRYNRIFCRIGIQSETWVNFYCSFVRQIASWFLLVSLKLLLLELYLSLVKRKKARQIFRKTNISYPRYVHVTEFRRFFELALILDVYVTLYWFSVQTFTLLHRKQPLRGCSEKSYLKIWAISLRITCKEWFTFLSKHAR